MSLLDQYPIEELDQHKLSMLVAAGVSEARDLDFKQETYGGSDEQRREFAADVTSLANTSGGHIIIGMSESDRIATDLRGISADPDQECLRLEELARAGIQPRIVGLRVIAVRLTSGANAIVIRVPRSFNPPHRVTMRRSNRFWARDDGGKYEPDVDQLRQLFNAAPAIEEKVRDFRLDRIAKIRAGLSPVPLMRPGSLVLHAIPFSAFAETRRFSIDELWSLDRLIAPMSGGSYSPRVNLEGVISVTGGEGPDGRPAYAQISRSAIVEAVRAPIVRQRESGPRIASLTVEQHLVDGSRNALLAFRALSLVSPVAFLVSLIGVDRAIYHADEPEYYAFDRDTVLSSEVVISQPVTDDRQIPSLLKPLFDEIANAAGLFGSRNFSNGHWRGQSG